MYGRAGDDEGGDGKAQLAYWMGVLGCDGLMDELGGQLGGGGA